MRTLLSNLIFFLFLSSFFYSCEEVDPPKSEFSSSKVNSSGDIYVKFTDMSTNSPDHWEWEFEGGFPKTSKEQNPTIVYKQPGVFDVKLIASNEGGSNEIIRYAHINIARIINNMPTEAEVKFYNETKTVASKTYIQFLMFDRQFTNCHIETSGKSANGEQQGLLIYWDIGADLEDYYFYEFGYGPEVAFFNVTNNSDYTFTHFNANVNNPDFESLEEVLVPNDGKKYDIGYYVANRDMEVRLYCSEGYVPWIEGYNFLMPWENNQSVDLKLENSKKPILNNHFNLTDQLPITDLTFSLNKRDSEDKNYNPDVCFVAPSGIK